MLEPIWQIDANYLMFKKPLFNWNFHNSDPLIPEIGYVSSLILNSCKLDLLCSIFGVPHSSKGFGPHFFECVIHALSELTNGPSLESNSPTFLKDYMSILVRSFTEFICTASFREIFNYDRFLECIKAFIESDRPLLAKYIALNIICESLPMCKSSMRNESFKCLYDMVKNLHDQTVSQLSSDESFSILLRILHLTWIHVSTRYLEEFSISFSTPPQALLALQNRFDKKQVEEFNDIFSADFAFYINIHAKKHEIVNKCYKRLISCYIDDTQDSFSMPKNFTVPLNPLHVDVDFGFFSQLKNFPLTQFCFFAMNYIYECAEKNPCYVLPPPVVDLIFLLTLGSLGNRIRFCHQFVVAFDRFRRLKAYNCLNSLFEMITYRILPCFDHEIIPFLLRLVSGLAATILDHKDLILSATTFFNSIFCQTPKLCFSFTPILLKLINDSKVVFHNLDINIAFLYHMFQASYFYGFCPMVSSILKNILRNVLENTSLKFSPIFLKKLPPEISQLVIQYENPFNSFELFSALNELKQVMRNFNSFQELNKLLLRSQYQRALLCLVFDHLLGDVCDQSLIQSALTRIRPQNIQVSIRTLIHYIICHHNFSLSDSEQITKILLQLINTYNIVQIDQFLFSLLLFYTNDENNKLLFKIIENILRSQPFSLIPSFIKSHPIDLNSPSSLLNFNVEFHKAFPEPSQISQIHMNSKPCPPLSVYYGNLAFRTVFLIDFIVWRSFELMEEPFFLRILEICSHFFPFHPCPIRSLFVTLNFFEDLLKNRPNWSQSLARAYLLSSYRIEVLKTIFSMDFCSYLINNQPPNRSIVEFSKKTLTKLACSLLYSRVHLLHLYGKTPSEFQNYHNHQILICSAIEFLLIVDRSLLVKTIMDLYFDFSDKRLSLSSINFYYYIQAFGLLFSVLPHCFSIACLEYLAVALSKLSEQNNVVPNFPEFCLINENTDPSTFSSSIIILLLLRSYFIYTPPGYVMEMPKDIFLPYVTNEFQFLLLVFAVTPIFQRIIDESGYFQVFEEIAATFIRMLSNICQNTSHFIHPLLVTDFFYIFKYKCLGDKIKEMLQPIKQILKPELTSCLTSL